MKKFFKHHFEWLLAAAAIFLAGILLLFFVWGIKNLVTVIGKTILTTGEQEGGLRFNIEEYERLNLPTISP